MIKGDNIISRWINGDDGIAAVEAAMVFPLMLFLFLGVFDGGNAILANQKTVRSSQIVADLITRKSIVAADDVSEAIEAGRLALEPMDSSSFGVDIVSIRFDDNADSSIEWRETFNMGSVPDALNSVTALQDVNEGVVMVSVKYVYTPMFSSFITGPITMNEVAFSRGRRTPVITRE
ncbi:MAG: TadE family protein [Alphaproteobacteria bacterium]